MSGRTIAPRPVRDVDDTNPQPGSAIASSTVVPGPSATPVNVRKKVTSACHGCQKRRVKCDGQQPCATCIRTQSECSYIPELDGRSIKRKYHEVQRDQDLLHHLLESIRYTKDDHVKQMITLIRSDATMAEVKACMSQQLNHTRLGGRDQSPELRHLQSSLDTMERESVARARTTRRPDILDIRRLVDQPLYNVPAWPWTTVTDDDGLVSNLISVVMTWDKGWYDWFDGDLFVREMQAGSLDSTVCSPFLVNSLLSWACPYSNYKEARSSNGCVSALMMKFVTEAKRLLELEKPSGLCLTLVQGLLVLHASLTVAGIDSTGYRYMLQAMGMIHDLSSISVTRLRSDPDTAKQTLDSVNRTRWGLFITTTHTLTNFLRPQMMKAPRRPRQEPVTRGPGAHMWIPYPYQDRPMPSYRDEWFDFGCDQSIIEAALSRTLFDVEEKPSRKQLEHDLLGFHERISRRVAELPEYLTLTTGCCASSFCLRIRIQSTTLRIFLTLREPSEHSSPTIVQMARDKCTQAAQEVARIIKLYMQSWGPCSLSIMVCHPIYMSISVLVEEQDNDSQASYITDLCVALRAMSRRWPLAMGMLRMVQLDARIKGWKLPADTDTLFADFEGSDWRQRELRRFTSLYPIADATKMLDAGLDDMDMGTFLEKMDGLAIEESAADSDG